jgi:hypothetical protein
MNAGQVGEQGEHRHDAGQAAEHGRGEVMSFETAERERAARERNRQRHPVYHLERGHPGSRHRSPRRQPAVDAEIDAEQVLAQIDRSDGRHREADRECEAQVLAGVHEREAEGGEAQGRHRFHGGDARAPARQHRQLDPPADERRSRNSHRSKASSLTCVLSLQSGGQGDKQRHIGSIKSKPQPAVARRPTIDPVRQRFQHKCLRERGYVFEDFLSEPEQLA